MLKKQTPAKYVLILFLLFTKNGFAHGFGTRYDLPLPLWMYLSGAVLAIVFSFVLLLWKYTPITQEPTRFRITRLRYIYRSTLLKIIRIIALIFYFLIIIAGFVGKQSPVQNLAPITIWAVWWVGMVYLSASCGNIWSWINPLNIFFQWMQASTGVNKKRFFSPSTQVGIWPAVLLFLIFTGMELNWQGRENPASLASMMIVYSIFTWLGMIFCGRKWWLKHVELFSIIFALFAKIAPSYLVQKPRRGFGEPLLVKKPISFSQVVFVILMLSTVSFDGLMETQAWQNTLQVCAEYFPSLFVLENSLTLINSFALLLLSGLFLLIFAGCCYWMQLITRGSAKNHCWDSFCAYFVLTLIPIALAYHIAHYLSFFVMAFQYLIPLASDPFNLGWDLFNTQLYFIKIGLVDAKMVWYLSLFSIVLGHVIAVYLAHQMATRLFIERKKVMNSQFPMLVLMVLYTVSSLFILAQPIVNSA